MSCCVGMAADTLQPRCYVFVLLDPEASDVITWPAWHCSRSFIHGKDVCRGDTGSWAQVCVYITRQVSTASQVNLQSLFTNTDLFSKTERIINAFLSYCTRYIREYDESPKITYIVSNYFIILISLSVHPPYFLCEYCLSSYCRSS